MIKRAFRDYCHMLALAVAGVMPISAAYSAPPTQAQPSGKATKVAKPAKLVIRAQAPDKEATPKAEDEFDVKLTPGFVPMAAECPDLPNNTNTPTPPAPYTMTPLPGGQFAATAQNDAPAFFGDFFFGAGSINVVPGSPLPINPLAVNILSSDVPNQPGPPVWQTDYFRQIFPITGDANHQFETNTNNQIFRLNDNVGFGIVTSQVGSAFLFYNSYDQVTTSAGFVGQYSGANGITGATLTPGGATNVVAVTGGNTIPVNGSSDLNLRDSHSEFRDNSSSYGAIVTNGPQPVIWVLTSQGALTTYSPSATSGGVQKIVDNASPLPRDRVFFNYNYFANTPVIVNGGKTNINRFTPGFEKTFFNQRMSIEVRVPFAASVDNDVNLTGQTNTGVFQLGNQTTYLKSLLYTSPTLAIAGGLGIQAPTAPSTSSSVNGYSVAYDTTQNAWITTTKDPIEIQRIKNESVQLLPYIGAVYTPDDRFFAQTVAQFNFATNGDRVYQQAVLPSLNTNNDDPNSQTWTVLSTATGMQQAGVLTNTNFAYLSANTGYWIYKSTSPDERGLTGLAPTVELHYNQSLQKQDVVPGFYGNSSDVLRNQSIVNGVVGVNTVFGRDKYLSVAYVSPFTTGVNKVFDGELRVMFNYYFGAPRINPRFANVPGQ